MSSRLTRTLLKLYPRRIRNRYGDKLLELQDELRAQDDVSRTRLIRDMIAGALLVRPARRRRPRATSRRCTAYPHVQPQRPLFVSG
jgi:hypothetical protein